MSYIKALHAAFIFCLCIQNSCQAGLDDIIGEIVSNGWVQHTLQATAIVACSALGIWHTARLDQEHNKKTCHIATWLKQNQEINPQEKNQYIIAWIKATKKAQENTGHPTYCEQLLSRSPGSYVDAECSESGSELSEYTFATTSELSSTDNNQLEQSLVDIPRTFHDQNESLAGDRSILALHNDVTSDSSSTF
ncbi:hypothetical protein KJZ61_01005 [Candidatus Dependentiae bacterium]|nr:hypothetical protein [Candidatus Dependentiae bacterium]